MSIYIWKCPHCGTINQDIFELTVLPYCGGCEVDVEWEDVFENTEEIEHTKEEETDASNAVE